MIDRHREERNAPLLLDNSNPAGDIGAAVVGGGLGLLGTSMTNTQNMDAVNATNAAQMQLQQNSEQWEEQMSDTSYQRGMADMKAAGLNPMLAYMQGGASTPGISVPNLQAPHFDNVIGSGVSSAMGAYKMARDSDKTSSDMNLNDHVAAAKDADATQSLVQSVESAKRSQALDLQMDAIRREAGARGKVADVTSDNAKLDKTLDQVNKGSQVFSNSAGGIADLVGSIGGAIGRGVRGLFQKTPSGPPSGNTPPSSAKQATDYNKNILQQGFNNTANQRGQ